MIEKPFGHDLASALELDAEISSAFDESQVFRIDHYLGKETVQNLQVLRFANGILEPIWNRRYVEHVQITMAEDIGIGHRAGYYDSAGAIRDVIQNHLMQLLALVGDGGAGALRRRHDPGREGEAAALRAPLPARARSPTTWSVASTAPAGSAARRSRPMWTRRASPDDSRTETYVAMRVEVDNWRWAGTPFYLRAGKRLPRRVTEIAVRFRAVPHLPFARSDIADAEPNEMVLSVQPDEGVSLRLGRQGPRPDDERQARADGVQVRRLVPGRLARGLRATAPRRPAGRRDAVHAGGRGGGRVEDRRPDPGGLELGAGPADLRGRQPGSGRGGRAAGRSRDGPWRQI